MSDKFTLLTKSPDSALIDFINQFKILKYAVGAISISLEEFVDLLGLTPDAFYKILNDFIHAKLHNLYYLNHTPINSWTFTSLFLDYVSTLKIEINYVLNWCYAYDIHISIYDVLSLQYLIDDNQFFSKSLFANSCAELLNSESAIDLDIVLVGNKDVCVEDQNSLKSFVFYRHLYNYLSNVSNSKLTQIEV